MKLHSATPTSPATPVAIHLEGYVLLFDDRATPSTTVIDPPAPDAAATTKTAGDSKTPEDEVEEWLAAVRLCFAVRGRWFDV